MEIPDLILVKRRTTDDRPRVCARFAACSRWPRNTGGCRCYPSHRGIEGGGSRSLRAQIDEPSLEGVFMRWTLAPAKPSSIPSPFDARCERVAPANYASVSGARARRESRAPSCRSSVVRLVDEDQAGNLHHPRFRNPGVASGPGIRAKHDRGRRGRRCRSPLADAEGLQQHVVLPAGVHHQRRLKSVPESPRAPARGPSSDEHAWVQECSRAGSGPPSRAPRVNGLEGSIESTPISRSARAQLCRQGADDRALPTPGGPPVKPTILARPVRG